MLGEITMLYTYTGSLLYRWGWGIKSKLAKALAKDKSLLKTIESLITQNYSASIQASTWWMRQASLGTQLINITLVSSHWELWSLICRWHACVFNIWYHEQSPPLQSDHLLQIPAAHRGLCTKMQRCWVFDTYGIQLRNYQSPKAMPLWTVRKGYYLLQSWFNDNTNHKKNPDICFLSRLWHNTSTQLIHINMHCFNKFPTANITEYKGLPYAFE